MDFIWLALIWFVCIFIMSEIFFWLGCSKKERILEPWNCKGVSVLFGFILGSIIYIVTSFGIFLLERMKIDIVEVIGNNIFPISVIGGIILILLISIPINVLISKRVDKE